MNAQEMEQPFLSGVASKGVQEYFYKSTSLSHGGFMFVAGSSLNNNGDYDIILSKYLGKVEVWSYEWNGSSNGDDFASNLTIDSSGNIVLVGTTYVNGNLNYDGLLLKINQNGVLLWNSTYGNPNNLLDGFVSVVTDNQNNIFVCGGTTSTSNLTNYLTAKYSSTGGLIWSTEYDYNQLEDLAVKLVLGGNTLRVSGGSQNTATDWKMSTVSYNSSTGVQMAAQQSGGDSNGLDLVKDIKVDGIYTYVVGGVENNTGYDWKIMKLNANLSINYDITFDGVDGMNDVANAITIDDQGNIYVTGYTTSQVEGKNFLTRKYSSNGNLIWSQKHHDKGDDEAVSIEIDASNNVYVTGSVFGIDNEDYGLIKYKGSNGAELWYTTFNSEFNKNDTPTNIALDTDNNIYLVGSTQTSDSTTTYSVCKYIQKSVLIPQPNDGFISSRGFVMNHGQIKNSDGSNNNEVSYYSSSQNLGLYVSKFRQSLVFQNEFVDSIPPDSVHRIDITFTKGNPIKPVYGLNKRNEYINFYLSHLDKPREQTGVYDLIIKPDAYNNTDVIYGQTSSGFRNWIVAKTGAPTGDFEMQFDGQDSLSIDLNGNLLLHTSIGEKSMKKAKAYSINTSTGNLVELAWQPEYVITAGNKISFSYPGTWTGTLVIELTNSSINQVAADIVNLDWSTYFGGFEKEMFSDIVSDPAGRSWVCGFSESIDFPLVPGPLVLNSNNGDEDALVVHFSSECGVNWITYYGGTESDFANAIDLIEGTRSVIGGSTTSPNLPNEAGGPLNDSSLGGSQDGFIIQLAPSGTILLDSYIGGDGQEVISDVKFNNYQNSKDIYIVGSTNSDGTTLPLINLEGGYFQSYTSQEPQGYVGNGFIMKMNADTHIPSWRTFFGSEAGDWCDEIVFAANAVFIAGRTQSDEYSEDECQAPTDGKFPFCATNGSWFNETIEEVNNCNSFLTRFDRNTNLLEWSTIIASCSSQNGVGHTQTNCLGSQSAAFQTFYLTGTLSQGASEFPFVTSPFQSSYNQTNGVNSAAYLMRFRIEGNFNDLVWSTLIDGPGHTSSGGIAVTVDGHVYMTGHGSMSSVQDTQDYCSVQDASEGFPLCDESESSYMETAVSSPPYRSWVAAFDNFDHLFYSSLYGNHHRNRALGACSAGDYVFICGEADYPETVDETWTLQEYSEVLDSDYYQDVHYGWSDGTIARFETQNYTSISEGSDHTAGVIQIYPNPVNDLITIEVPNFTASDPFQLRIFDQLGRQLYKNFMAGQKFSIPVDQFSKGVYTVVVSNSSNQIYSSRFVKL